jgi:hypothetical protein
MGHAIAVGTMRLSAIGIRLPYVHDVAALARDSITTATARAGSGAGFAPFAGAEKRSRGRGCRRGLSSHTGGATGHGLTASMAIESIELVREFRSRRPRRASQGTATRWRVAAPEHGEKAVPDSARPSADHTHMQSGARAPDQSGRLLEPMRLRPRPQMLFRHLSGGSCAKLATAALDVPAC